jgi:hypothetical protein
MNFTFDQLGQREKPTFVLCNPDREQLYALGEISNPEITLRYNAMSELKFNISAEVDGSAVDYFSLLEYPRKVYVESIGYFIIIDSDREHDGINQEKTITCYSDEYVFATKKIVHFEGTYKFYDLITPAGTFLQEMIDYVPGWTVSTVDASLLGKYRTFDTTDTNTYQLMMEEAETKFQCVFEFDTINKTVSVKVPTVESATTDIYLSHDNLLVKTSLQTITEELVTALSVYGAGDLSINSVNPLGTNTIYNFDYFKTTAWMSGSLIAALDAWDVVIDANQATYNSLLTQLRDLYDEKVTLDGELVDLETEWDTLEGIRKVQIEGNFDIADITAQCDAKQLEIDAKEVEITAKQAEIDAVNASLAAINTVCSFATNFAQSQLDDLQNFVFGSTYQNDAFLQTDIMTNAQIQDMAQNLYDQAQGVLEKVSVPRYNLSVESTNFLFLEEFDEFIDQLSMGSTITIETDENTILYPALLEMTFNYDQPDQFSMTFSNRLRVGDPLIVFTDFFGQTNKAVTTTTFNSELWSNFQDNYKDDVSTFITSALDASLNNLISSTNQEIKINENGLKGKRYLSESDSYSPEQVWLTSNTLAFTDDAWNTVKLALGKLTVNGVSVYGLCAPAIVGQLIAGNNLIITNESNTFVIDSSGVTITNANIDVTTTNGNTHILIDPVNGLKIQKKVSGSWVDKFYANADGDLTITGRLVAATGDFSGTITATAGTIGGITINSQGIQKDANNYIRSNGDFKWGMLTMTGGNAYFNGNIYANNLLGLIQYNQIGSVDADTITVGTLTAIDIYGCQISWPGAHLFCRYYGHPEVYGEETLKLSGGSTDFYRYGIDMSEPSLTIRNPNMITIGGLTPTPHIRFIGQLFTRDVNNSEGYGASETLTVKTSTGQKKLNFVNGLLVKKSASGDIPPNETYFTDFGWTFVVPCSGSILTLDNGNVGYIEIPFDCEITSVRLVAGTSSIVTLDIKTRPYATWNALAEVSIVGVSPPLLNLETKYENTLLTNWATSLTAGDYLVIRVVSNTTTNNVYLSIRGKK